MALTATTRLLAAALGACAVSALFGMYLVLEPVVLQAGRTASLGIVLASVIDLILLGVAGYVANKASQAPASGGEFLGRGWRLLQVWLAATVVLLIVVVLI